MINLLMMMWAFGGCMIILLTFAIPDMSGEAIAIYLIVAIGYIVTAPKLSKYFSENIS